MIALENNMTILGHMVRTNISQLKAHLSEALQQVKQGKEIIVTERNIPIAKVIPISPRERQEDKESYLVELERKGIISRPRGKSAAVPKPLRLGKKVAIVETLLKDREFSRW